MPSRWRAPEAANEAADLLRQEVDVCLPSSRSENSRPLVTLVPKYAFEKVPVGELSRRLIFRRRNGTRPIVIFCALSARAAEVRMSCAQFARTLRVQVVAPPHSHTPLCGSTMLQGRLKTLPLAFVGIQKNLDPEGRAISLSLARSSRSRTHSSSIRPDQRARYLSIGFQKIKIVTI